MTSNLKPYRDKWGDINKQPYDDGDEDGELFGSLPLTDIYGYSMRMNLERAIERDLDRFGRLMGVARYYEPTTLGQLKRIRGVEAVVEMPTTMHLVIWIQNEDVIQNVRSKLSPGILVEFCIEEEGLIKFL